MGLPHRTIDESEQQSLRLFLVLLFVVRARVLASSSWKLRDTTLVQRGTLAAQSPAQTL